MGTRRSQFNVAQALAPHLTECDFDAALVADHAAVLHALIFAAQAFPVGNRTENLRAEQTVALRLKGPVINRFGLGDFAMRPGPDLFRAGQTDANGIKIGDQAGAVIRAATIQGGSSLPKLRSG